MQVVRPSLPDTTPPQTIDGVGRDGALGGANERVVVAICVGWAAVSAPLAALAAATPTARTRAFLKIPIADAFSRCHLPHRSHSPPPSCTRSHPTGFLWDVRPRAPFPPETVRTGASRLERPFQRPPALLPNYSRPCRRVLRVRAATAPRDGARRSDGRRRYARHLQRSAVGSDADDHRHRCEHGRAGQHPCLGTHGDAPSAGCAGVAIGLSLRCSHTSRLESLAGRERPERMVWHARTPNLRARLAGWLGQQTLFIDEIGRVAVPADAGASTSWCRSGACR